MSSTPMELILAVVCATPLPPASYSEFPERGNINWVAFSPDSTRIIAADNSIPNSPKKVWLYHLRGGRWEQVAAAELPAPVVGMCVGPAECGAVLATRGGTLFSLKDGASRAERLFDDGVGVSDLRYSRDGRRLGGVAAREIRVWSMPEGRLVNQIHIPDHPATSVVVDADVEQAASLADQTVVVWNLRRHERVMAFRPNAVPASFAFSPDGSRLAVGSSGSLAAFVDRKPESWDELRRAMAEPGSVSVWEVAAGRRVAVLPLERGMAEGVAWHPAGRGLVIATNEVWAADKTRTSGEVIFWELTHDRGRILIRDPAIRARTLTGAAGGVGMIVMSGTPLRSRARVWQWDDLLKQVP